MEAKRAGEPRLRCRCVYLRNGLASLLAISLMVWKRALSCRNGTPQTSLYSIRNYFTSQTKCTRRLSRRRDRRCRQMLRGSTPPTRLGHGAATGRGRHQQRDDTRLPSCDWLRPSDGPTRRRKYLPGWIPAGHAMRRSDAMKRHETSPFRLPHRRVGRRIGGKIGPSVSGLNTLAEKRERRAGGGKTLLQRYGHTRGAIL